MPKWAKEDLCVTCKYKDTNIQIQAGIVTNKCGKYEEY